MFFYIRFLVECTRGLTQLTNFFDRQIIDGFMNGTSIVCFCLNYKFFIKIVTSDNNKKIIFVCDTSSCHVYFVS